MAPWDFHGQNARGIGNSPGMVTRAGVEPRPKAGICARMTTKGGFGDPKGHWPMKISFPLLSRIVSDKIMEISTPRWNDKIPPETKSVFGLKKMSFFNHLVDL